MSTRMIRLADAQAAIRHAIEYYARDVSELQMKAAQRGPGEEPDEGEETLLIAAKLAQEGAERARHALATVPVYEAVDFAGKRIIDKRGIPEQMHDGIEENAVQTLLHGVGKTAHQAGMIDVRWTEDLDPERSRLTLRFTMMRPEAARWEPPTTDTNVHGKKGEQK